MYPESGARLSQLLSEAAVPSLNLSSEALFFFFNVTRNEVTANGMVLLKNYFN